MGAKLSAPQPQEEIENKVASDTAAQDAATSPQREVETIESDSDSEGMLSFSIDLRYW